MEQVQQTPAPTEDVGTEIDNNTVLVIPVPAEAGKKWYIRDNFSKSASKCFDVTGDPSAPVESEAWQQWKKERDTAVFAFKGQLGYTSVKITGKDLENKVLTIMPLDKAGDFEGCGPNGCGSIRPSDIGDIIREDPAIQDERALYTEEDDNESADGDNCCEEETDEKVPDKPGNIIVTISRTFLIRARTVEEAKDEAFDQFQDIVEDGDPDDFDFTVGQFRVVP